MKGKRAQVTLFVIIGIMIVVGGALYFILRDDVGSEGGVVPEHSDVTTYVIDCLDRTLDDVLLMNALQGGYYKVLVPALAYNDDDFESVVPYYLIDERVSSPSVEVLEEQISLGIESEIDYCLDFYEFSNVEVDFEGLNVETSIDSEIIDIELTLPLKISNGEDSSLLSDFELQKESSYFYFYEIANEIVDEQVGKTDELCLTCIREKADDEGYNLTMESFISGESYEIVNIISKDDEPYYYGFAYKFNQEAAI